MNVDQIRAELELNLGWRLGEVAFLKNQVAGLRLEEHKDMLRRSAVLVLYSHFEGFSKLAFTAYVTAINNEGLVCRDVSYALAASTMSDVFGALRDANRKCIEFRNTMPDDTGLHRFARDREFLERADAFDTRPVQIPDEVVDPESNLKPGVLRKILYRIGLPHTLFETLEGDIDLLLRFRNEIAHGVFLNGISEYRFNTFESAATRVMSEVLRQITMSLALERFRRRFA